MGLVEISNKGNSSFSERCEVESDLLGRHAVESAVDAHANRLILFNSPSEACIDPSLGPYVTSIIRCSLRDDDISQGIDELSEFESLLELLEEHCMMDREVARTSLRNIYVSVRTGRIDSLLTANNNAIEKIYDIGKEDDLEARLLLNQVYRNVETEGTLGEGSKKNVFNLNFGSNNHGGASTFGIENEAKCGTDNTMDMSFPQDSFFSDFLDDSTHDDMHESFYNFSTTSATKSPLRPSTLIPTDLLTVMDEHSSLEPEEKWSHSNQLSFAHDQNSSPATIPLTQGSMDYNSTSCITICAENQPPMEVFQKSLQQPVSAGELAASLFHPSRSRSNSVASERATSHAPGLCGTCLAPSISPCFHERHKSTVQIFLSMNAELGMDAATQAIAITNADINMAQCLLDAAKKAPAVCRHMLNNACYRSDCQFSHDVDGHTCLFWLRGRCGKGDDVCRFLHGFSESLHEKFTSQREDGVPEDNFSNFSDPIKTTNLVQHNMMYSRSHHQDLLSTQSFLGDKSNVNLSTSSAHFFPGSRSRSLSTSSYFNFSSVNSSTLNTGLQLEKARQQNDNVIGANSSFASVASKGYTKKSFTDIDSQGSTSYNNPESNRPTTENTIRPKHAKIPQDLWNPNNNRDSSLFHIPDPMERYHEVMASQARQDVIDLHFQSLKTFPTVLSTVISEKLDHYNDVWVVTGSGHHVSKSTHQKGGGILENAVISWLQSRGYTCIKGRDRNGFGGAVLVKANM